MIRSFLFLLLGAAAGAGGMLAYQQFAGAGKELEQVQGELAAVHESSTAQKKQEAELRAQIETQTHQIEQLQKEKREVAQNTPAPSAQPGPNASMAPFMKAAMANQNEKKFLALKARLHLTPEQETLIKKLLEDESARNSALAEKMMKGEKVDMAAMRDTKNFDRELEKILTPEQKKEHEGMQEEEKKSQRETMATFEMNQIAPALGLNEEQKDDFFSAIYQAEQNLQDPEWIKKNSGESKDPLSSLKLRQQAKKEAAAQVLTPAQLETYSKQLQSEYEMQKAMIERFMPAQAK